MKTKLLSLTAVLVVLFMLAGAAAFASGEASSASGEASGGQIDASSSASATRTLLTGDALEAAVEDMSGICSDLATAADVKAPGYQRPANSKTALILSVNPDGAPGMSTIQMWKIFEEDGEIYIKVVMTDGQNIRNLCEIGDVGTLIVHGNQYYILRMETVESVCLEYSDEAYAAGLFNQAYSGASAQRCEYTVTFRVFSAEATSLYMFN